MINFFSERSYKNSTPYIQNMMSSGLYRKAKLTYIIFNRIFRVSICVAKVKKPESSFPFIKNIVKESRQNSVKIIEKF